MSSSFLCVLIEEMCRYFGTEKGFKKRNISRILNHVLVCLAPPQSPNLTELLTVLRRTQFSWPSYVFHNNLTVKKKTSSFLFKFYLWQLVKSSSSTHEITEQHFVDFPTFVAIRAEKTPINPVTGRSGLSTWKYQFSYDHWSQATLSSVSTWMGDCSSVAWGLLLTHKVG